MTLDHLLSDDARMELADGPYFVCRSSACDVVYFGRDGRRFAGTDLRVPFGLKDGACPRTVCYCFDHTLDEIEDEFARTGCSTVPQRIEAEIRRSGCRCEATNPLGACCLPTIKEIIKGCGLRYADSQAAGGKASAEARTSGLACCATGDSATTVGRRTGVPAIIGSVTAAALSSACCWLPLLLVALGASAVGVAGFFEAYRPHLLVCAVVLLGLGFHATYFRASPCAPASSCANSMLRVRRFNRAALWIATILVGAFALFPNYVGSLLGAATPTTGFSGDVGLAMAEFSIEGMTCEGCAAVIRSALSEVPNLAGVEVDYARRAAIVRYEAEELGTREQVIAAIRAAGYEVGDSRTGR